MAITSDMNGRGLDQRYYKARYTKHGKWKREEASDKNWGLRSRDTPPWRKLPPWTGDHRRRSGPPPPPPPPPPPNGLRLRPPTDDDSKRVQCKPCARWNKRVLFLALRTTGSSHERAAHWRARHVEMLQMRQGIPEDTRHGVSLPSVQGSGARPALLAFQCELYPDTFGTAIGRSQHFHFNLEEIYPMSCNSTNCCRYATILYTWSSCTTQPRITYLWYDQRCWEVQQLHVYKILPYLQFVLLQDMWYLF